MANVDVCTKQRVVIEFLTAEGSSPIGNHRLLRSMYGEDAIDVSSVRWWVRWFESREKTLVTGPAVATSHGSDNSDQRQG
jgi:hypothetical protein